MLADLDGPGTIRHVWMTFPPAPPDDARAVDGGLLRRRAAGHEPERVGAVPRLLRHAARAPVRYASALTSAQEGRGFNSYLPMPFAQHVRVEVTNSATTPMLLYYQIDYTLEPALSDADGILHVAFRRENPTVQTSRLRHRRRARGPGRFVGCNVGVRVLDEGMWYGEGEMKVYRDGDAEFPTICGTGLEDYVGSAWGLGTHSEYYAGRAVERGARSVRAVGFPGFAPVDFVGFYRWHLADPIMYRSEPARHDPADRRDVLRQGSGSGDGAVPPHESARRRGMADRRSDRASWRRRARRAGRRLLRHVVRVLPPRPARPPARHRRRRRRHHAASTTRSRTRSKASSPRSVERRYS